MLKLSLKRLLKISRPKFWHYLAGPYAIGAVFIYSDLSFQQNIILLLGFFYYLLFGNFFVYGINDFYDQDTDILNPEKKNNLDETLLKPREYDDLVKWLWLTLAAGVATWGILVILNIVSYISFLGFLLFVFFSWGYSSPPIRAKSRPFLDGIFNLLYVMPAITAYGITGDWINISILIPAILWCMAMHAFSAVPDIVPDSKAGLNTTAVLLGAKNTLLYCLGCYLLAIGILWQIPLAKFFIPGVLLYVAIMIILYFLPIDASRNFYKYFPLLNFIMGMYLFLIILMNKLSYLLI